MKNTLFNNIQLSLALFLFLQAGRVVAQTIPLTNTKAAGLSNVPSGWINLWTTNSGSETIDVANINGAYGDNNWVANPLSPVVNPPTAHNLWIDGFAKETAGTTITGLTVGIKYDFTFYIAEIKSKTGGPSGLVISNYDGTLELGSYTGIGSVASFSTGSYQQIATFTQLATYPFTGGDNNSWSKQTYTFTATAPTLNLAFRYLNPPSIYGNFYIWNLSVGSNAVVPSCRALFAPDLTN